MTSTVRQALLFVSLTIFTSFSTIFIKQSRSNSNGEGAYSITAAVFLSEVVKLAISVLLVAVSAYRCQEEGYVRLPQDTLEKHELKNSSREAAPNLLCKVYHLCNTEDALEMSVPAALYVIQNILQLFATSYVSSVTYQAIMQLKMLTLAGLTTVFLGRTVSSKQWTCLLTLLFGVFKVSMSRDKLTSELLAAPPQNWTILLSITSIFISCCLGSASSVFIESRLKSKMEVGINVRNAQLAFFSLMPALVSLLFECIHQERGFVVLHGFSAAVWATVMTRSIGAFLVAAVLKHTDAIYKGISSSLAIILTIVVEAVLFGQPLSAAVIFGAIIVSLSSALYSISSA